MRFTLRTILAYLDDTLEPTQTRELGHRINKSESAKAIIDRIKTVVRRRRLLAPDAALELATIDANDVAEYVDNVGPGEQLAKTEKKIFESDMHLAEVAVTHQIAALGLTTLAAPSERLNRRVERILADAGVHGMRPSRRLARAAHANEVDFRADAENAPLPLAIPRFAANRTWGARFISVGLVLGLGALLAFAVNKSLSLPGQSKTTEVGENARLAAASDRRAALEAKNLQGDDDDKANLKAALADKAAPANAATAKPDTGKQEVPQKSKPAPIKSDLSAKPAPSTPPVPNDGGAQIAAADLSKPETASAEAKLPATKPEAHSPTEKTKAPVPKPPAPTPLAGLSTAKYISESGLLFRRDAEGIVRLTSAKQAAETEEPADEAIRTKDDILQPDGCRSTIELAKGARIELVDQTKLSIPADSAFLSDSDFAFVFYEGRLSAQTAEKPALLKVGFQNAIHQIGISGNRSTVVLERRIEAPGLSLSEASKSSRLLIVTVVHGEAIVGIAGQPGEIKVPAGTQILLRPGIAPETKKVAQVPAWVYGPTNVPESNTARQFASDLAFGAQAVAGLREKLSDARRDYCRLAVKSLAALERVDLLAEALTSKSPEVRSLACTALRHFAFEDAARVDLLRNAFATSHTPEDQDRLVELVCGYGPDLLENVETYERLIAMLEAPDSAVGELAYFNLREITGKPFRFDSKAGENKRRNDVVQWSRWLRSQRTLPPPKSVPAK